MFYSPGDLFWREGAHWGDIKTDHGMHPLSKYMTEALLQSGVRASTEILGLDIEIDHLLEQRPS